MFPFYLFQASTTLQLMGHDFRAASPRDETPGCVSEWIIVNCITGSDLGCWMLERLSVDDGKKTKISFTAWACPQVATAVVEAFNTVLCVRSLLEQTDVTMQVDNETLYDICRRSLDIDRPTYTNLNRLIASFAPLRRGGARDATN